MTDELTRIFRDKTNQKQYDRHGFVKRHSKTNFYHLELRKWTWKIKLLFLWLILIASKARAESSEVHGTAGSNSGTEDFTEKGKFVPKEEIEGFHKGTLKRLSLGYSFCVFTTPTSLSSVFNIFYFLRTIKFIRQTKIQTRNVTQQSQNGSDFPIFARIAVLMGFSRLFGFFAMLISKYLFYPFIIPTTFQGVYIATTFVFSATRVRTPYYSFITEKLGSNAFSWSRSYTATVEFCFIVLWNER